MGVSDARKLRRLEDENSSRSCSLTIEWPSPALAIRPLIHATLDPIERLDVMAKRSRRKLRRVEFSSALKEHVVELHRVSSHLSDFYVLHLHEIRKNAIGLSRDVRNALNGINGELRPVAGLSIGPRSKKVLRRLLVVLAEVEEEAALLSQYAGAKSLSGRRGNNVLMWIAGRLQGEAQRTYKRDVKLPWSKIEEHLFELGKTPARDSGSLAKDVSRNRRSAWFKKARKSGLDAGAAWPQSTALR